MNKLSTYFSRLAMLAIAGFTISSCTTAPGDPGTNTTTINDGVAANSNSSTSIGLRWNRLSTDVTADTVYVSGGGGSITPQVVSAPTSSTVIGGLTEGVAYTFTIHAAGGVSQNPVTWMTAARSPGTVRLYETADNNTGEYSGLILSANPQAVPVSHQQNATTADLVFASDPAIASGLSLISPSITSLSGLTAGRATFFSDTFYSVTQPGLDNLYFTGDVRNLIPTSTSAKYFNADTLTTVPSSNSNSTVILMKTADNHFAKVEILPQAGGLLYGGTPGHNYIDLRVSYQNSVDQPYATRGHAPALTSNSKHAIGHMVVRN